MLNKLTKLQALQVSTDTSVQALDMQMARLGFNEGEKLALLDSGASQQGFQEDGCVPVRVELAGGQWITLQQNRAGTPMPTSQSTPAQETATMLPMGALVQQLGCELTWTRRGGLKITHPEFGVLKTVVKGNCPLWGEAQALSMIHQLEQKKLQELKKATAETFLQTMSLSDVKDWDELFGSFVRTGSRATLMQALQAPGSPLQGLENQLVSTLSVDVDLTEEAGKQYLKKLPLRRAQRKSLLIKRWILKLHEREGEGNEAYKIVETDKTVFLSMNVHSFSMIEGHQRGLSGSNLGSSKRTD